MVLPLLFTLQAWLSGSQAHSKLEAINQKEGRGAAGRTWKVGSGLAREGMGVSSPWGQGLSATERGAAVM